MTSPAFLPVHAQVAEIAAGRLSPVDLVDEYLARIERLEPALRAFVSVNAANARLAAEAATKRSAPATRLGRCTAFRSPSRIWWKSRARWRQVARPPGETGSCRVPRPCIAR